MKIHHAFPISRPTMELRLNNRLRLTNTQELPIFLKRFATGKTAAWEHHWQQWAASLSVLTPVIINAVVFFLRHVNFLTNIGRMTLNFSHWYGLVLSADLLIRSAAFTSTLGCRLSRFISIESPQAVLQRSISICKDEEMESYSSVGA